MDDKEFLLERLDSRESVRAKIHGYKGNRHFSNNSIMERR